ncbi:(5-formylfuran-3-yl)methyl phosphate synthase [Thiorhodococcus minor]|uniref:(5-formylfuran-3-yl)methyl phosphate synthase n=1 Tax=Thiorhodococcus minor TaxID=57489 RepID=A0A6M0K2W6_9GAMM|nr:(5-formylfuran-3-yl)methyl phosphate synthase [Thiorhodococcus minor]NEV63644.1 hypothetical protein [Thiorhodococcus minor]
MTRMLASVTNAHEATTAIQAGVDLIDLKDPASGALGALPLTEIQAVRSVVGGRHPISATIGDLPPAPAETADAIAALRGMGIDYVKVGFFSAAHLDACLPVIADLSPTQAIVAVLFADTETARADLEPFAKAGCAGVMLDTADKAAGRLCQHLDLATLGQFVARAKSLGLMTGLAGSLRITDIAALQRLGPSYLGFRGALCHDGRRGRGLDPQRLRAVRQSMLRHSLAELT